MLRFAEPSHRSDLVLRPLFTAHVFHLPPTDAFLARLLQPVTECTNSLCRRRQWRQPQDAGRCGCPPVACGSDITPRVPSLDGLLRARHAARPGVRRGAGRRARDAAKLGGHPCAPQRAGAHRVPAAAGGGNSGGEGASSRPRTRCAAVDFLPAAHPPPSYTQAAWRSPKSVHLLFRPFFHQQTYLHPKAEVNICTRPEG